MGWWTADSKGNSLQTKGDLVWGDSVADIMDNALDEITKEFQREWGRVPTFQELQSGFLFSARVLSAVDAVHGIKR